MDRQRDQWPRNSPDTGLPRTLRFEVFDDGGVFEPSPTASGQWPDETLDGNSLEGPLTASDYLADGGAPRRAPDLEDFVHWLYHHPRVMAERAAVFALREQLLWEEDGAARVELGRRSRQLADQIDDRLSRELVVKRPDWRGPAQYHWVLLRSRLPRL